MYVSSLAVLSVACGEYLFTKCVMLCSGSYGTLARFRSISRLSKVNDTTLVGASGDVADCQYVKSVLEQKM